MNKPLEMWRPQCRADCVNVPRPCPYVGCRHNLFLSIDSKGRIESAYNEVDEMPLDRSCVLDIVERGEQSTDEIAEALGLSRQRIQQIEEQAMRKFKRVMTAGERK